MKAPPLAAPLDNDQRWVLVWAPHLADLIRCTLQGNRQAAIDAAEEILANMPNDTRTKKELIQNEPR